MSVATIPQTPAYFSMAGFHQLSVAKYHKMIEVGVLTTDDKVELLEGYMVQKMPHNPPHDVVVQRITKKFVRLALQGWEVRIQSAITLSNSEPEPDAVIARGDDNSFSHRHPGPSDVGLVVEVADSSLNIDRLDKTRIYAQSNLKTYWIANVVDRQIEVYTDARPNDPVPAYATRTDYRPGDSLPLVLDGQIVAQIPVNDLLS